MNIITFKETGVYEMPEEIYDEMQEAAYNTEHFLEIAKDYCDFNMETEKIAHLLVLIEMLRNEFKRITDKF